MICNDGLYVTFVQVSSKPATPLVALSPLRLLTSSARCRLTLKKRLADCSLVTSRLFVVFDQLLWVLTDAQMVAALHFANSLADLIEKATDLSHKVNRMPARAHLDTNRAPRIINLGDSETPRPSRFLERKFLIFDFSSKRKVEDWALKC